jgi:hypothetical protein
MYSASFSKSTEGVDGKIIQNVVDIDLEFYDNIQWLWGILLHFN